MSDPKPQEPGHPSDDEAWLDEDLLEQPEPLAFEQEGPEQPDESLEDFKPNTAKDAERPSWTGDWVEQAGAEAHPDEQLLQADDLLHDGHGDWEQDPTDPTPAPTPPPAVRRGERPSPPSTERKRRSVVPKRIQPQRPENLVFGYRVMVDLPELQLTGVPARSCTGLARSILRANSRPLPDGRLEVQLRGVQHALPYKGKSDAPQLRLKVTKMGREAEVMVTLEPTTSRGRLLMGRDILSSLGAVVDVTRADS